MSRRSSVSWIAALALGIGVLGAGCGPASVPPPVSQPVAHHHKGVARHHTSVPSHPPSQSALGVSAAFRPPFSAALQGFRTTTPAWQGAVAPSGTVVDQSGQITTSGVSLATAWHQWQHFSPHRAAGLTMRLTAPLATGTNGGTGMPAVGIPAGQSNVVTTAPNVAIATGVVTAGAAAHPFSAVFARLASGWVLVTWRWL